MVPRVVRISQVVAAAFAAMTFLRFVSLALNGQWSTLYGRFVGPLWVELIFLVIVGVCLMGSAQPGWRGLAACSAPLLLWFMLTAASPESWTGWHWLPYGGPVEPWGIPRPFTYEFRYATHEQLVGACVAAVVKQLLLGALLATLFLSKTSRTYFQVSLGMPARTVK